MNNYEKLVNFIRELYNQPTGAIPLHHPRFWGNEKRYLGECIDSTYVSSIGKFVDQFEVEVAKYTGAGKAVACVSGTNALSLALRLVGVQVGHEVITQPLTFVATANAIAYCGAQPVFIDVDRDTMGLSPTALEKWFRLNVQIGPPGKVEAKNDEPKSYDKRTGKPISACVPMHTFGHPCRIDEIVEICQRYHVPVVEDAAESLGSFYKKQHTGTFGRIGILSFNGNKIITTGGGGMLLFQDEELAIKAKHLTTQAKLPHPWEFVHDDIGYNYRMPNINAALGLGQIEQLPVFLKSKRRLAGAYQEFFSNSAVASTFTFIPEPPNAMSNYWLNCVLLKNRTERDAFLKYTNENGVMTRPTWRLMHRLPMYEECPAGNLTNSVWLEERLVNLPSSVPI